MDGTPLVVLNRYGCLNLRITVFSLARGGGYLHLYHTLITAYHEIGITTGSLNISIATFAKTTNMNV